MGDTLKTPWGHSDPYIQVVELYWQFLAGFLLVALVQQA